MKSLRFVAESMYLRGTPSEKKSKLALLQSSFHPAVTEKKHKLDQTSNVSITKQYF